MCWLTHHQNHLDRSSGWFFLNLMEIGHTERSLCHKCTAQQVFTSQIHRCNQNLDPESEHDQHRNLPWPLFQLLQPFWGETENSDSRVPVGPLRHILRGESLAFRILKDSSWGWYSAKFWNSWPRLPSISHPIMSYHNEIASIREDLTYSMMAS